MSDNGRKPSAALMALSKKPKSSPKEGLNGQTIHFDANRLRSLREQYNLHQETLANLIGCSRATIVNLERGTQNPNIGMLKAMAYHFGVTTDYLLGMDEYTPEDEAQP